MTKHFWLAALGSAAALASSPASWELNTYQDFAKGRLTNLALTRDGRVTLAPRLDRLFDADQPVVWSIARGSDGSVYLGTGHKGRLYRVDAVGKASLLWTAGEAEIFAVAVDPSGRVFAATSPSGKVYRIDAGKAVEYFDPKAKYIWSIAFGRDGAMYVGTGDEGKVWRVTAAGQGQIHYETGQSNVTSLAFDSQGRVLAGTEPNGILYRIESPGKAFVLLDANYPEIRAIAPGPNGSTYVAAMGGAAPKQIAAATAPGASVNPAGSTPVVTTTITVTDDGTGAQAGEVKPKPPEQAKPQQQQQQTQQAATPTAPTVEYAGVEKSAVYRIHADNTVEQLWTSKEENAYDLVTAGADLLLATDNQGRVYRMSPDRKLALVAETRENEVVRMLAAPGGVMAVTGESGKLFRLADALAAEGEFEAPVHDATAVARWGKLTWRASACDGCALRFRTRTGNSARPDKTWSEWSAPLTAADGAAVASPNARFIQWKAEFSAAGGRGPELDSARLSYLPQNTAPTVKSVTVTSTYGASPSATKPATAAAATAAAAFSITITDTGESSTTSAGTATQPITRAAAEYVVVTWTAEDPEQDRLTYSLHFRGEGESEWKPLLANTANISHTFDAELLADGRYWFRVTASDKASNPPDHAREAELISAPILVDRTPPVLTASAPRRDGTAVEIRVDAADSASPVRAAEYSIDAGPWIPLAAADGVPDSTRESFTVRLDPAPSGERLVVIRAYDSANNAGVVKAVIRP